ncbi:FG-GAP-like repeat-containing protein [Isoptericola sp. BMS4]|uniref:FG-GAP-like repeat-containing protein n=1 Tax=Isoptericola sp. BMS4 TaxID=2527875 RepID=UPI001422D504|nr:FG-GAP-like repeat-containing protein [Isoptericola sp. BMS4]
MNHRTTRRPARLAATMAAAGLVLAAAPQALAADAGDGAMTLTSTQADDLADRVNVDVYGDDAPEEAVERDDAGDESSAEEPVDPDTPVTFTEESVLEGVQGMGVTAAAGDDGDYFTLHSLGNVQRHAADGATSWTRTVDSLYDEWGVRSWRPWETELYRPHLVLGYNAVSPFAPQSDQGYDTGDLSGDGVEDLVFSTNVGTAPPGWSAKVGTYVTVLDGATGATLWSKLYDHAAQLAVVDGTLLLADSPSLNGRGEGGTATLTGMRFVAGDGALTPAETWTYDTETTDPATWAAIEDLGDGSVAAVWDLRKTDTNAARGRTLVLDVADGTVRWTTDSDLYGRQLHLDASRDRLVALEQADQTDGVRYQIASYDLDSGERTTLDTRVNALPTAMTVGELKKGGGPEYAVSESTLDPNLFVNASTVRVLDGDRPGVALWSRTTKRDTANGHDGPSSWELTVVDGSLVVSSQDDADMTRAANVGGLQYGSLTVLTGSGKVRWQHDGASASPMAHEVVDTGHGVVVRTIDLQQNVRTDNLGNGKQAGLTPLRGDVSSAQSVDVDGDGLDDVVAGGTSRGVWAWSGTSLTSGEPRQLWQATVAGQVHGIETGDVDGDGDTEVVVAADTATTVLDAATGEVVATIDGAGRFVRSVTVADVDGDGADEILVPTDALRVYRGDGTALWTYAAPQGAGDVVFSDTVVADGRVHTQYGSVDGLNRDDATQQAVALDGQGAELWAATPDAPEIADGSRMHGALLDHAVFASPEIPYADGHAVVHTWLIQSTVPGFPDTAVTPHVVTEIRDGRTGELLHRTVGGSPWSHGNYFTNAGVLYQLSFGTFHGFAADGVETYSSVTAPLRSVDVGTGPGGRALLLGGVEGGVGAWDPAVLTTSWSFQSGVGSAQQYGGRNYLAADLDGDGVDEMVSLNFDDFGVNRTAELVGGGVFGLDNGIHRMVTYSLS